MSIRLCTLGIPALLCLLVGCVPAERAGIRRGADELAPNKGEAVVYELYQAPEKLLLDDGPPRSVSADSETGRRSAEAAWNLELTGWSAPDRRNPWLRNAVTDELIALLDGETFFRGEELARLSIGGSSPIRLRLEPGERSLETRIGRGKVTKWELSVPEDGQISIDLRQASFSGPPGGVITTLAWEESGFYRVADQDRRIRESMRALFSASDAFNALSAPSREDIEELIESDPYAFSLASGGHDARKSLVALLHRLGLRELRDSLISILLEPRDIRHPALEGHIELYARATEFPRSRIDEDAWALEDFDGAFWALRYGNLALLEDLIKLGAPCALHRQEIDASAHDSLLVEALRAGDLVMIDALLDLPTARNAHRPAGGFDAVPDIIVCARENLVHGLELLLARGIDVNEVYTYADYGHGGGMTALSEAARADKLDVIRLLLDAGADPTISLEVWSDDRPEVEYLTAIDYASSPGARALLEPRGES